MSTRTFKHILLAVLALIGMLAGEAFAQSATSSVTVNAAVPRACRFYTASSSMNIQHGGGQIDPTSGVNATGSTTLNYRCTNGVSPRFDIDTSGTFASPKNATAVLTSGVNNMSADITVTATGGAGTGLGGGQDKTATVDGFITPANFQAAATGNYSKILTIGIEAIP